MPLRIFSHEKRRTNLLDAALRADDPDQIGTAELQIMRSAIFVEMFNVRAGHGFPVVFGTVSVGLRRKG